MSEPRTASWTQWNRHLGTVDTGFGDNGDFVSTNMWVNNRGLLATTNKPYSIQPHDYVTGSGLSFSQYAQVVGMVGGFAVLSTHMYRLLQTTYVNNDWSAGGGNPGAGSLSENGVGGMWSRFGSGETGVVTGRAGFIFGNAGNTATLITSSLPAAATLSVARNRDRLFVSQQASDRVFYGGLGGYGPLNGTAYFDVGAGDQIHSLVSCPAGLLIFADNAIYILRGDPQGGDMRMLANIGTLPYASSVGDETFAMSVEGDPVVITGQGAISRPAPQFKVRPYRYELLSFGDHFVRMSRWQTAGSSNGATVFMICCNGSRPAPNDFWGANTSDPANQSVALVRKNGVWVPFVFDRIANGVAWGENMAKLGAYDYVRNRFEFFGTDDYPDDLTGPPLVGSFVLPYIHHEGARLNARAIRAYIWHFPNMGNVDMRGAIIADYRNTQDYTAGPVGDPTATALQRRPGPLQSEITAPMRRCYTWNLGAAGWGRALRVQFAGLQNCAFERVELDYDVQPGLP